MIIRTDFIHDIVNRFHDSVLEDGDLCKYAESTPENANYADITYQKIYALRYLPAYYFEYAILANLLNARLHKNRINTVNIASMGCGLLPDYYALQHNLIDINFSYHGYDCCNWESRDLLPAANNNLHTYNASLSTLSTEQISKFDVIIFPKSIGDIGENCNMRDIANSLSQSTKKRVFFLNSFITKNHDCNLQHVGLFEGIHNCLISKGFQTADNYKNTFYRGAKYLGLKAIDRNFDYPELTERCNLPYDECQCSGCQVTYSPIFTNAYMNYQVLEYYK